MLNCICGLLGAEYMTEDGYAERKTYFLQARELLEQRLEHLIIDFCWQSFEEQDLIGRLFFCLHLFPLHLYTQKLHYVRVAVH
jgi:hypothetical protein